MIVDSPLAKMAVENSLEQLTDQLSKAGVELDKIEVMLSDSHARHQFFDRRPAWSLDSQANNRNNDELNETDPGDSHVTAPLIDSQYLGTRGVNLLA